jgi:hypothetical protein
MGCYPSTTRGDNVEIVRVALPASSMTLAEAEKDQRLVFALRERREPPPHLAPLLDPQAWNADHHDAVRVQRVAYSRSVCFCS